MADAFDLWRTSKLFVVGDEVSTAQELKRRKQRLWSLVEAGHETETQKNLIGDVIRDAVREDPKIEAADLVKLAQSAAAAYRAGVKAISGRDCQCAVDSTLIRLEVLADGCVVMSSTCEGRFDSSYMPMPDWRVPAEVAKLLAELREKQAQLGASGSA